ncbi:MAG: hypothetical protein H7Z41_13070 [Cytophagales bacterium]|nr:hypothetical protein [Armatimonadota bacterium]
METDVTATAVSAAVQVKKQAEFLGIDAARITTAAPPGHSDSVAAWLAAGMHGKMAYLERRHELRSAPLGDERLLAGARSVVMVALSYDFPPPAPFGGALSVGTSVPRDFVVPAVAPRRQELQSTAERWSQRTVLPRRGRGGESHTRVPPS